MQKFLISLLAVALFIPEGASGVTQSKTGNSSGRGVSLELSDPTGSIYSEGESVSFTVLSDTDAYVLVFNIDTEGYVHLIYPREGEPMRMVQANLRYPIPQAQDEELTVGGKKGMEFVFAVSVRDRDAIAPREISRLHESERMPVARRVRVQGDPFLAANKIAGQLVRGIGYSGDISLAYTYFFVGGAVDYPRYMCEDCDQTGKDPYGVGMPEYVATTVFDSDNHLRYPLDVGFERTYEDALARPAALQTDYDGDSAANTVYVTYYPNWYTGYYGRGYWDPWFYPWGWGAGYRWGGGFYFGVGWNWGWWGYGYATPYYGHHYSSYDYASRSLRHDTSKYRYKDGTSSTLHTAMTTSKNRQMRQRSKSVQTAGLGSTRLKSTSSRPAGQPRSLKKATRRTTRSRHSLSAQYKRTYRGNDSRQAYSPRAKKTVRPDSRSRTYRSRTTTGKRTASTSTVRNRSSRGRSGSKATYRGGSKSRSSRSSGRSVRSSSGSSRRSSAGKSRGSSGRRSGGGSRGKGRR